MLWFVFLVTLLVARDEISVKDFGAKGDGVADDTAALQRALDAVCLEKPAPRLYLPQGTFNIRAPLVTRCATAIRGAGPAESILFQTVQSFLNQGIVANDSLTLEDLAINTAPLSVDRAMMAVERCGYTPFVPGAGCLGGVAVPSAGLTYRFTRFASSGFNFGIGISGTTNADVVASVVVQDSKISTSTAPNKVSNPINAANITQLTVEDSTLIGDGHSDHAVYAIAVRGALIRNNRMENYQDSEIKILTQGYGAGGDCPAVTDDYTAWTIEGNRISQTILPGGIAIAAYTYCDIRLPVLSITNNIFTSILDSYTGNGAAVYILAACRSVMEQVDMSGNVFQDIGLGGVLLISGGAAAPCADPAARGTIAHFTSTGDKFINWSVTSPGSYAVFAATGPNLQRASISQLTVDRKEHGGSVWNPGRFSFAQIANEP